MAYLFLGLFTILLGILLWINAEKKEKNIYCRNDRKDRAIVPKGTPKVLTKKCSKIRIYPNPKDWIEHNWRKNMDRKLKTLRYYMKESKEPIFLDEFSYVPNDLNNAIYNILVGEKNKVPKKLLDTNGSIESETFEETLNRACKKSEVLRSNHDFIAKNTERIFRVQGNFTVCVLNIINTNKTGIGVTKRNPNMDINNRNLAFNISTYRALMDLSRYIDLI